MELSRNTYEISYDSSLKYIFDEHGESATSRTSAPLTASRFNIPKIVS